MERAGISSNGFLHRIGVFRGENPCLYELSDGTGCSITENGVIPNKRAKM